LFYSKINILVILVISIKIEQNKIFWNILLLQRYRLFPTMSAQPENGDLVDRLRCLEQAKATLRRQIAEFEKESNLLNSMIKDGHYHLNTPEADALNRKYEALATKELQKVLKGAPVEVMSAELLVQTEYSTWGGTLPGRIAMEIFDARHLNPAAGYRSNAGIEIYLVKLTDLDTRKFWTYGFTQGLF
jgi:hypothetical protein